MQRTLTLFLVAVALSGAATPLSARESSRLVPGAHIRWVSAAGPASLVVGRVEALRSDTLFAEGDRDSSSHVLPLASLASLEVSRGPRSDTGRYALVGAAAGGLSAVAFAKFLGWVSQKTFEEATGLQPEWWDESNYVPVALIGAGVGAGCGAIIASMRRGLETWEPVGVAGSRIGVLFKVGRDPALGLSFHY